MNIPCLQQTYESVNGKGQSALITIKKSFRSADALDGALVLMAHWVLYSFSVFGTSGVSLLLLKTSNSTQRMSYVSWCT